MDQSLMSPEETLDDDRDDGNDILDILDDIVESFHMQKANIPFCERIFSFVEMSLFDRTKQPNDTILNDTVNIGILDSSGGYTNPEIARCYDILIEILHFLKSKSEYNDCLPKLFEKEFVSKIFNHMDTNASEESKSVLAFFEEYLYFPKLFDTPGMFEFIFETIMVKLHQSTNTEDVDYSTDSMCLLLMFFLQKNFHALIRFNHRRVFRLIERLHSLSYYVIFNRGLRKLTVMYIRIYPEMTVDLTCKLIKTFSQNHPEASNISRRMEFSVELHYIIQACYNHKMTTCPEYSSRLLPKLFQFFQDNFKLGHTKLLNATALFWYRNRQLIFDNKQMYIEYFLPITGKEYMCPESLLQHLFVVDFLTVKHFANDARAF